MEVFYMKNKKSIVIDEESLVALIQLLDVARSQTSIGVMYEDIVLKDLYLKIANDYFDEVRRIMFNYLQKNESKKGE